MSHNPQPWTKEWASAARNQWIDGTTCPRCHGTGVIETGNNDLPCDCEAGNKALFNSAGVGLVTGAELRKHYFNSSPEPLDTVPNRGRALVVDDDRDNREYVAGILRKGGFDVVEARDGRTGLRTHRTSDEGFAVVVSDWSMPYMMGTEMVQKIRELSPEQPVLMMSSEPGSVRRILTELNIFDVKVLFKSYEPEEMLTAVLKTIVGEVANEVAH